MISIITPVYNARNYVEDTIQTVLAQTYADFEWILVEDCSPDKTGEYLQSRLAEIGDERIRLFCRQENHGAADARNYGLAQARGRYICYLDADDLWASDKLEKELDFLQQKEAGFVFTGYEFGDENAVGTGKVVTVPATLSYRQALKNTTIFTTTVMFDTEKIPKEKLVMPNIKSEDTALWWNVLRDGTTAYGLNENLAVYRRPAKSLSSNKVEAIRRIWNLYRRHEKLSVVYSAWNFLFWAVRAVIRRV